MTIISGGLVPAFTSSGGAGVDTFNGRAGDVLPEAGDYTAALVGAMAVLVPTAVKTTNYNAAVADLVPCNSSGGAFTVTLPTAPSDESLIAVKIVVAPGGHNVTIAAGGSDVFNVAAGATSLTLSLLFQGVVLQYKATGAIWYVLTDDLTLASLDLRYTGIGATVGGVLSGTLPNPGLATTGAIPTAWTATTQTALDNSTKIATTAYADGAVATSAATKVSAITSPDSSIVVAGTTTNPTLEASVTIQQAAAMYAARYF